MAFLSVIIGIISDLIRTNRMLIEDTLEHTKKMRFGQGDLPAPGPFVVPETIVQREQERVPLSARHR